VSVAAFAAYVVYVA